MLRHRLMLRAFCLIFAPIPACTVPCRASQRSLFVRLRTFTPSHSIVRPVLSYSFVLHLHVMMHKFSCLYLPFYFKIRINMLHKESDAHKFSTHMAVVPSAARQHFAPASSSIHFHMWHKSYRTYLEGHFSLFRALILHEVHTNPFHIRFNFDVASSSRAIWQTNNKQWKNRNVTLATNFHRSIFSRPLNCSPSLAQCKHGEKKWQRRATDKKDNDRKSKCKAVLIFNIYSSLQTLCSHIFGIKFVS